MAEKILHAFPTMHQATCFFDNRIKNTTNVFSRLQMFYDDNLDNRYYVRRVGNMAEVLTYQGLGFKHVIHHNYDTPELKQVSNELAKALSFSTHFLGNLNVPDVSKVCTCGVKFTGGICSDWCDLVRG